jgi:hypothetical protein
MHTRRHLLVAVGAAATAGCSGALGGESGERGGDTDADRVRLGELSVQNNHDDDHRVQLAVEADDEMLHLGTYDLGGDGESRTLEGTWTDNAGSYRIHARLDDGEIRTADVTDGVGGGTDCVRVLIRIDAAGDLAVWNGANCGTDADDGDLESV